MNLSGMVMHYAFRIFICKSGVSGFNPTHKKRHRKEKFRFSLAVGGSAGNAQISSLVLHVTQGWKRTVNIS
jgi:hypothetical protein